MSLHYLILWNQVNTLQKGSCPYAPLDEFLRYSNGENFRGGGALPYWRWRGRAAGQGMIFTVIHIGTGYLNRHNWLLTGYSVYHRVASGLPSQIPSPQCLWKASNLGTSDATVRAGPQCLWQARDPRDLAPATARAGRNRFLWMYDDTQQNRESVRTTTGYAYERFSKVYWDRVYFLRAEWFVTGSGFRHPAAPLPPPPPPPVQMKVEWGIRFLAEMQDSGWNSK